MSEIMDKTNMLEKLNDLIALDYESINDAMTNTLYQENG